MDFHASKDIVLFSTADWDNPFWTNKQHVAVELAQLGHRVFYIESIGLRQPSGNKSDLTRLLKRLIKGLKPPREVKENLWVWSPLIIPVQGNTAIQFVNNKIFIIFLFVWLKALNFKKQCLWSYNPLTTEYLAVNRFETSVYHCVDEIKSQPGMPIETIEKNEQQFLKEVDIVFTTSQQLQESRVLVNRNSHYFSNVADFRHFNKALNADVKKPDALESMTGPILGFVGAISDYKIDVELLLTLADSKPDCHIVLIGQVGEGQPGTTIAARLNRKNIHLLGPRAYAELPQYIKYFDVCLLPCVLNDYTKNMFPMKFFEYLAAGKQVVSTQLHALSEYEDDVYLSSSVDDFLDNIDRALNNPKSTQEMLLNLAKEHTYEKRMERMLNVIEAQV